MKKLFTLFLALTTGLVMYAQKVGTTYTPQISQAAYHDVSPPLSQMAVAPLGAEFHQQWKDKVVENKFKDKHLMKTSGTLPVGEDPLWQKEPGSKALSQPLVNFEGTRNSDNGSGLAPPDVEGDVGPNHYFQMCNVIFQIFDKSGNTLLGPADNSTIWSGFIGPWTGSNDGDPIVLYDEQADRWLVSQFAVNTTNGTYWELVAISTTPDPTGSYYRYAFQFASFPDYPKLGVWRDGYYITVQHGTAAGDATAAVFERDQMLVGGSAQMVSFAVPNLPGGGFIGMLPSDNDGAWAPAGTPAYLMYFSDDAWGDDPVDRLKIWEFHTDWTTPANSTLTLTQNLNTTPFDSYFSYFNAPNVGQPGTTQGLATLEGALMHRLQYRNFGSYETMVLCHTIDLDDTPTAGIRWYELRKPSGGSWSIYQEGTYAPGSDHYWMASIAMNGDGDIALGYSVSSESTYPSIRYTGRLATDPLGTMTFTEQSIVDGTHYQGGTARWGDYTAMTVDPSDDETFWYTNEYLGGNGWSDWVTQIASFRISPYCEAGSSVCDEYIANVQMGAINNPTACSNYADYTDQSTDLPLNLTETVTVTNGSTLYSADQCGIWVDWNRDGDFYDANETITVSGTPGVGPYTATIAVPSGTTTGPCTMRTRITFTGAVDPCGITTYGEVEDYTINVVPAVPNTWNGSYNHYWHNSNNWSLGHIPVAGEDVLIPNVGYQPVLIDYYNEACDNLTINSGATLEIYDQSLDVFGLLDNSGTVSFMNAAGVLNANQLSMMTGTVNMTDGTFNISLVTDNGIFGTWSQDGGSINIADINGFSDMNCNLTMNGGTFTLTNGGSSWWGYSAPFTITMTGGVLDLNCYGIYISSSYPINENITGGTIRTSGYLDVLNASFLTNTGTFEMYGPNDASISNSAGTIYNLVIDKASKKSVGALPELFEERDGTQIKAPLSNTVYCISDVTVAGNLTINSGTFRPDGFTLNANHNVLVYGTFMMDNGADIVNVGTSTNDWLWFLSGSVGDLQLGTMNMIYGINIDPGVTVTAQPSHVINFNGTEGAYGIIGGSPAQLGAVNFNNATGTGYLQSCVDLTIDNFTLAPGAEAYNYLSTMVTFNNYTDDATSGFSHFGAKGSTSPGNMPSGLPGGNSGKSPEAFPQTIFNNDVMINGTFDIAHGDVTALGLFESAPTGQILCNDGGTLTCTATLAAGWNELQGALVLSNGTISYPDANLWLYNTSISGGILAVGRSLKANAGSFTPSAGLLQLVGSASGHYVKIDQADGNYVYDLSVDRTSGSIRVYIGTTLRVENDLTINSGTLYANGNLSVGGYWTNNVGVSGFSPGTSLVEFNSSGAIQYVYGENNFYDVVQQYAGPALNLQFSDPTVIQHDFEVHAGTWINDLFEVQGTLNLDDPSSAFTANFGGDGTIAQLDQGGLVRANNGGTITFGDVIEDGIYGSIEVLGGTLNYNQDASNYPDINATVYINGGVLNVSGGNFGCVIGFSAPCSITMSDGEFNFPDQNVSIATFNPLTENITGGILRFTRNFSASHSDFTPTGGTIEMTGGADAFLDHDPSANFWNVTINKSGGKGSSQILKDRDGNTIEAIMANTVNANSSLNIQGDLNIDAGTLSSSTYTFAVSGDVAINNSGILTMSGGTLDLAGTSTVNINSGGLGQFNGSNVTSSSGGYYGFNVNAGGTISAFNSIFEYMDFFGVYVRSGSTVDPANAFDNCTFREGQSAGGSSLLTLDNEQYYTVNNANFPTNTWGSAYNVWKSNDAGGVNFVNASGGFDGSAFEYDPNSRVGWSDGTLDMHLTVMLEGPYDAVTGMMNTSLLSGGYIPLNQPYNPALPYYGNPAPVWLYSGSESVGSVPANVVDWVVVQLRDADDAASASSATVLDTRAGFLLANGHIVETDGVTPLQLTGSFTRQPYIVVFHRNHLGVMTSAPVIESGGFFTWDFTTDAGQAYGGSNGHKEIDTGVWGMVAADGNANGLVQNDDETSAWKVDLGGSGYLGGDFNLNGLVQNTDETGYWKPNLGGGGQVPAKSNTGYASQVPK
ncbi:MAG: hypothetical protein Kow00127_12480 [Bacteroidales bacterium]